MFIGLFYVKKSQERIPVFPYYIYCCDAVLMSLKLHHIALASNKSKLITRKTRITCLALPFHIFKQRQWQERQNATKHEQKKLYRK